jgi:hypothetical protein
MPDAGYLCDPASSRIVLARAGLVCPAAELAMALALAPRTPVAFVGFTLLNNALLRIAWAGRGGGHLHGAE